MIAIAIVFAALVLIAAHFIVSGRRARKEAERRRFNYVHATGRTGRLHGLDEALFREAAEKRSVWTQVR